MYKLCTKWPKCYYEWYRKYILERDWNACVISWVSTDLHIHHIKTRGAWGTNEYCNLITLSWKVHREKAHWMELWKYRDIFLEYTSWFDRPEFWDTIMENSIQNEKQVKKNRNKRNWNYMKRSYQKVKVYRKKVIDKFKLENNWLSPWQVNYRKQKWLL